MSVKYPDRATVVTRIHDLRAMGKMDKEIARELQLTQARVIVLAGRRRDDPSVQKCKRKEIGYHNYKGGRDKRMTIRCTSEFNQRLRELVRRCRQGGVKQTMADVLDWLVLVEFESPRLIGTGVREYKIGK